MSTDLSVKTGVKLNFMKRFGSCDLLHSKVIKGRCNLNWNVSIFF